MIEIKLDNFEDFSQYIEKADYRIYKKDNYFTATLKLMIVKGGIVISYRYPVNDKIFFKKKNSMDMEDRDKIIEETAKGLGFIKGYIEEFIVVQQV